MRTGAHARLRPICCPAVRAALRVHDQGRARGRASCATTDRRAPEPYAETLPCNPTLS